MLGEEKPIGDMPEHDELSSKAAYASSPFIESSLKNRFLVLLTTIRAACSASIPWRTIPLMHPRPLGTWQVYLYRVARSSAANRPGPGHLSITTKMLSVPKGEDRPRLLVSTDSPSCM